MVCPVYARLFRIREYIPFHCRVLYSGALLDGAPLPDAVAMGDLPAAEAGGVVPRYMALSRDLAAQKFIPLHRFAMAIGRKSAGFLQADAN